MPTREMSSGWKGYVLAVLATAAAALARVALPETLAGTPYLVFYPALVGVAVFTGLGPGLLATAASALTVNLLFDDTEAWINFDDPFAVGRLAMFLVGGVGVSLVAGMRRAMLRREREHTERTSRAAAVLREQEASVRRKLDSLLAPAGDIGDLALADIIDVAAIQSLVDEWCKLVRMPMSISDLQGNVLVGGGWQRICAEFHRVHPELKRRCMESDLELATSVAPGEFRLAKCQNGMWQLGTPLHVGGRHVGNLISGQFFFEDEPPDREMFRAQARQYGLNEEEYLAALDSIPLLSRSTVNAGMAFLVKLANALSLLSYSNIRLARSSEALRKSEALLRAFVDSTPDPVFVKDREGRMLLANPATLAVFGKPAAEVLDKLNEELITDRALMEAAVANDHRVMADGCTVVVEETIPTPQGHRIFLSTKSPYRDAEGCIQGVVGVARDITERKRSELEKEVAVQFLNLVNEVTGTRELIRAATTFFQRHSGCEAVGIRLKVGDDYPYFEARGFPAEFIALENYLCERDATGEIVRDAAGSPVVECMCGNVIRGRFDPAKPFFSRHGSFWTNSTTELLTTTTEADRQARTRNRCNGEGYESVALLPLRIGEERLGLLQLNDHRKGRFSAQTIALWERLAGYLAVAVARSRAEEALRESEERLRLAQEAAHAGTWEWDLRTNANTWSEELWPLYGLEPHSCQPSYAAWLETVLPEDRAPAAQAALAAAAAGTELTSEWRVRNRDGRVRWLMSRGQPQRDERGQVVRYLGIAFDITQRKLAEEERERLVADLARSNAELEQFASLISHDLLTPVVTASTYASLLVSDQGNQLSVDSREALGIVQEGVVRMNQLIRRLLDYSRLGKGQPNRTTCSAEAVLSAACQGLASTLAELNAEITHDALPTVLADPTLLAQVFQNLLENSCRYRGTEPPRVHVAAHQANGEWIFSVTDNGIGIDPRYFERIFQMFQRLHRDDAHCPGLGVGLAFCKRIVEQHGGRMWVESKPGAGASFMFTLPAATPAA